MATSNNEETGHGAAVPAYDHGFIVPSAAEKRLTLASASVQDGPVWLIRRAPAERPNSPPDTILSCLVNYQDGVQVSHYKVVTTTAGRVHLVDPDGGDRTESDYDSMDQLLTAYKIPEGMPPPAPIGIFVPNDATDIWGKKKEEAPLRRDAAPSAQETRFAYKCQLCGLAEGTVEPFLEHVLQHSATERDISSVLRLESGDFSWHARGVHLLVTSAQGPLTNATTRGQFLRAYRAGRQYFQSAVIRGVAEPTWNESTFIPVGKDQAALRQPIRIELCARESDGKEVATAIGEIAVDTLQFNEPFELELPLVRLANGVATTQRQVHPDATLSLTVVLSRRDMAPPWKPSPGTLTPDDGILRKLTPLYRQLREKKKQKDAQTLPAQIIDRLGKLLYECPPGGDRKSFEKSVVEWTKDTLVKKCPDCGESFGMTRRRHHCRLCGGVVCNACSVTLDIPEASEMVKEVVRVRDDPKYENAVPGDVVVRSCSNCVRVAEQAHVAAMKLAKFTAHRENTKEQIAQVASYYQVLIDGLEELQRDSDLYRELAVRLSRYEGLEYASRVPKLYAKMVDGISVIDKVSKKIITFSTGMDFLVFENVREVCVNTVGRLVNQLPAVPPEAELRVAATKVARLRKSSSSSISNSNGKSTFFEVWEVQRHHPKLWFSPDVLGESDWQPWSSADGSWGYFSQDAVNAPAGSVWVGEWFQSFNGGDGDGWQYAAAFSPKPDAWSPKFDRTVHVVRRRRWCRAHGDRRTSVDRQSVGSVSSVESKRLSGSGGATTRASPPGPAGSTGGGVAAGKRDVTSAWQRADAGPHSPLLDRPGSASTPSPDNSNQQERYSDSEDEDGEHDGDGGGRGSVGKAAWIKDSATKQCMLCTVVFTKRRRRHHCRHCGRVVCGKCSEHRTVHAEYKKKKGVRTCDQCFAYQQQGGAS
eukprot:m.110886 g.110886  ORF g.110886 m.110886 type:complete len:929 (+) comp10733_c0_seq2:260-3046(+)